MLPIPINMMLRQKAANAANSSPVSSLSSTPLDTVSVPQAFSQKEIADLERILPKSPLRKATAMRETDMAVLDLESMLAPNSPVRDSLSRPAISIDFDSDYNASEIDSLLSNATKYAIRSRKHKEIQQPILP
jgi:hypothetical protein